MKVKRVGIFPGSFDPIHNGHVAFAEAALNQGLDKVFFLVEPRPRRKQGVRALEHRMEMVRIVAKKHPKFGVIQLDQAKFTPAVTLPLLQARFKGAELVLLFGDDVISHMVDHLTDWPHIKDLAASSSLLISSRKHQAVELAARLKDLERYGLQFSYKFIENLPLPVSSSEIRRALRKGESLSQLDQDVADYISDKQLYVSSS